MSLQLQNQIILGDCLEKMKTIPDNLIDMIFPDYDKKCSWFGCGAQPTGKCRYCGKRLCFKHYEAHEE